MGAQARTIARVRNTTFAYNAASVNGGAIYASGAGHLLALAVSSSVFSGNWAMRGGALMLTHSSLFVGDRLIFAANNATVSGGAVAVDEGAICNTYERVVLAGRSTCLHA